MRMIVFFRQIVPYQKENGNLVKMSSADLFGQIVIWNLNDQRIQQSSLLSNQMKNRLNIHDETSYTNGHTR